MIALVLVIDTAICAGSPTGSSTSSGVAVTCIRAPLQRDVADERVAGGDLDEHDPARRSPAPSTVSVYAPGGTSVNVYPPFGVDAVAVVRRRRRRRTARRWRRRSAGRRPVTVPAIEASARRIVHRDVRTAAPGPGTRPMRVSLT